MTTISDMQFDQLIGAGCARKVCGAWVGNVAAGLGHNYRRAVERQEPGPLAVENHSNFSMALGLKAAAMGVPFLPTRTLMGSDFRDESFVRRRDLSVHAGGSAGGARGEARRRHPARGQRADEEGNSSTSGATWESPRTARHGRRQGSHSPARRSSPHEVILSDPNRTLVPGHFWCAAVACVPLGSHPSPTQGYSRRDDDFYFDYHAQSRDRAGFEQWLERWVLGVDGHDGYMERLEQRVAGSGQRRRM